MGKVGKGKERKGRKGREKTSPNKVSVMGLAATQLDIVPDTQFSSACLNLQTVHESGNAMQFVLSYHHRRVHRLTP